LELPLIGAEVSDMPGRFKNPGNFNQASFISS
jgi:hypothetical protein